MYLHRDQLGSTTAVTDEAGVVIERLAHAAQRKVFLILGNLKPAIVQSRVESG